MNKQSLCWKLKCKKRVSGSPVCYFSINEKTSSFISLSFILDSRAEFFFLVLFLSVLLSFDQKKKKKRNFLGANVMRKKRSKRPNKWEVNHLFKYYRRTISRVIYLFCSSFSFEMVFQKMSNQIDISAHLHTDMYTSLFFSFFLHIQK